MGGGGEARNGVMGWPGGGIRFAGGCGSLSLTPVGQQQLLLLVLGIVFVGLAVVGGIAAFKENTRKSALDLDTARTAQYAGLAVA